jgi:N-acetylmuramoyl-L-alanine amidase
MNPFDPCVGIAFLVGQMILVIAPGGAPEREAAPLLPGGEIPAIVVDAGHGGRDHGARWGGLSEKVFTLDIACKLRDRLEEAGFPVVMTRTDDRYIPLADRVAAANGGQNALLVSIHLNSSPGVGPAGIETYYAREKVRPHPFSRIGFFLPVTQGPDRPGEELAALVHAALYLRTGSPDRGIRGRGFYVLRHSRCPAILVEVGFLNNPFEARLLANDAYRRRIADAIAVGISAYHRGRPAPQPMPALASVSRGAPPDR